MTTVEKPWGNFKILTLNVESTVKILTVLPGQKLSLQRHKLRDEVWLALDEGSFITYGMDMDDLTTVKLNLDDPHTIVANMLHRLENHGPSPIRVLEISYGEFDENDIERFADIYGRL